jgi:hypothetical protein
MLKLNAKLQLPSHGGILALHWYEWDTLGYAPGSNYTKCDRTPPAVAHMSTPPVPTPPVPTPPVPCPPELTRAVSAESPHDHALHDHAVPGPQRCGFDTHYPNYFPARVGCKEAVHAMQAAGEWVLSVCQLIQIHTFPDLYLSLFIYTRNPITWCTGIRTIPYINGQLFDKLLPRYATDHASRFAAKLAVEVS